MDGVAYLLSKTYTEDMIGQRIPAEGGRMIFVSEGAITRNEWFKAGQNGMNPEIMLTTPAINYAGETVAEYKGILYGIYRTYHKEDSDEMELYLRRKGGV